MSVAQMQKVLIVVDKDKNDSIVKSLHKAGIIEITKIQNELQTIQTSKEDHELVLAELSSAITFLEEASNKKKSFIESFAPSKQNIYQETMHNAVYGFDWKTLLKKIKEFESILSNLKNLENKLQADIEILSPWQGLKINLSFQTNLERFGVLFGVLKEKSLKEAINELITLTPYAQIEIISKKDNNLYVSVIFKASEEKIVSDLLIKKGVVKVLLPQQNLTVAQELNQLKSSLIDLYKERKEAQESIKLLVKYLPELKHVYDYFSLKKQEKEAKDYATSSKYLVFISGWVKETDLEKLKKSILKISSHADVIPISPNEGEIIPTSLENPKIFKPFEVITKIFGVPGAKEVDPTQALSLFYLLFFAICLSDVAYGLILSIVSYYLLKKLTLQEGGRNLLILLFWGGILSMGAGILTGSYFAIDLDSLPKSGLKNFILSLKIIDPIKSPLVLLIASLAVGVIQNIWGLLVGMYWKIKQKDYLSGLFDFGFWIYFLLALVFLLISKAAMPGYAELAKNMSILGATLLVLTQGRNEPGIIKKAISGILSLYRTTAFLGDTLSYSRLLALMMTTSIIGMVVNILAGLTSGSIPILGYVIMVLILVIGHAFNLIVSVLGAFVHSMRLQLVEFFGKFYEGSGREFKPFKQETKYVIIKD